MKGLLRISYYNVEKSIKYTCFASCILIVIGILGPKFFGADDEFSSFISYSATYAIMGMFAGMSFTLLFNNSKSKWDKFVLTSPASRKDVIKSIYISFLLFALVAIAIATIFVLVTYLVMGNISFDKTFMGYTVGILLLLGVPAFLHPSVLMFGIDKGQFLFLISTALSLAILFLPSFVIGAISGIVDVSDPLFVNVIYRSIAIIISIILFAASYYLSVSIYSKRDL